MVKDNRKVLDRFVFRAGKPFEYQQSISNPKEKREVKTQRNIEKKLEKIDT